MRFLDKKVLAVIHDYAVLPWMKLEDGGRHARLVNLRTGDFIPLAGSSSDHRANKNAKAAARRLAETGCGLISARTRRTPQ